MIKFRPIVSKHTIPLHVPKALRATKQQLQGAMQDIGTLMKRSANDEILHGRKTGRLYIIRDRLGRRRRHRASAPWETHANLTGALRRSLAWRVRSSRQLEFGYGAVKDDAPPYANFVEKGTRRMKPRPSLLTAIRANRRNAVNLLARALHRGFGK